MTQIYESFEITADDTLEDKMHKLYLGILSVGEDVYCKGAHLGEINKGLLQIENRIAQLRKDFDTLKSEIEAVKK